MFLITEPTQEYSLKVESGIVWLSEVLSLLRKVKKCTIWIWEIIIIIIIKICSAHISTLLGAQGAETEKTSIQTIYSDSKNKIMRYMYNSITNIHHLWKIVT